MPPVANTLTLNLLLIKEIKLLILIVKVFDDNAFCYAPAPALNPPASFGPSATPHLSAPASSGKENWFILGLIEFVELGQSSNSVTVIFKSTDRIL